MKKIYLFLLFTIFIFSGKSFSQTVADTVESKRPKVGLVLSGGGAKGFAYIGLFKVLKEIGLHIDYIGGASIGSIMAGFYSAGYDPDTLPYIISEVDWDDVMKDKVARKYVPFIDKEMGEQLIIQLPIVNKKKKISLKQSLYEGQNVDLLLSRYFARFYKTNDFSKMPVPVFFTGTDLLTGNSVMLKSGNLEKAIRSSMSIPGYFKPIHYGDKYLVDGGVVNNYPAKDMRNLGMDFIIGGDVQQGLEQDINKLNSVFSVINQIIGFSAIEATKEGEKNTDMYIHFDMGPYNMMSFNDYDSIIAIGEKTARAHYDELKKLTDSLNAIEYKPGNDFSTEFLDSINILNVKVEGNKKVSPRYFKNLFKEITNEKISISELEKIINILYGSGFFDLVTYRFEEPEDVKSDNEENNNFKDNDLGNEKVNLVISVQEKGIGVIAAGIHYDSDYNIGLLFNASFQNLLVKGSKLFINMNLSQNMNFKFTYLMDRGPKPGLGISGNIYTFTFGDYDGNVKVNELKFTNYKATFFVSSTFINQFNFQIGGDYEYFRLEQNIITDTLLNDYSNFNSYFTVYGSFKMDTWNKAYYPTKGHKINARIEYVLPLSRDWVQDVFKNSLVFYTSWGGNFPLGNRKKFVFQPGIFAGFTVNGNSGKLTPVNHWFGLGGLNQNNYQENISSFIGTKFIQMFGLHTFVAKLKLQYNVYKSLYVMPRYDIGSAWGLEGKGPGDEIDINVVNGYGLTLGYDSFIGPAEITVMGSNVYGFSMFLSIGYSF
jgi:NTE family protein